MYLLTFKSVSSAMLLEDILLKNNIYSKIIPTPRAISASCGFCLKITPVDKDTVLNIADINKIHIANIIQQ